MTISINTYHAYSFCHIVGVIRGPTTAATSPHALLVWKNMWILPQEFPMLVRSSKWQRFSVEAVLREHQEGVEIRGVFPHQP